MQILPLTKLVRIGNSPQLQNVTGNSYYILLHNKNLISIIDKFTCKSSNSTFEKDNVTNCFSFTKYICNNINKLLLNLKKNRFHPYDLNYLVLTHQNFKYKNKV